MSEYQKLTADFRARLARRSHERSGLPLSVSREELERFAALAPRGTRWEYSMPGVLEGPAKSLEDADAALQAAYRRTGVTHAYIAASTPQGMRIMAWAVAVDTRTGVEVSVSDLADTSRPQNPFGRYRRN